MLVIGIVENEVKYRSGLEQFFTLSPDYVVGGVWSDAKSAINGVLQVLPDVIFVELQLPGMGGIECIRRLKQKCPGVKLLVLTWHENDEMVLEAFRAGASGYLLKSDGPELIIKALRELQQGGAPMSMSIASKLIESFQKKTELSKHPALTVREKEVLQLLALGKMYKEIAIRLLITTETAKKHVKNIYHKLNAQNRTEAINIWNNLNEASTFSEK
ncbi:response regulator [Flavitalea sp.]|nr:response regulator transcription factor [Flavitalea sp.]